MTKEEKLRQEVEDLRAKCEGYANDISLKDNEIAVLQAHIETLRLQIAEMNGASYLARKMFGSIDSRVMETLTRRGQRKKIIRHSFRPILIKGNETYDQLIELVQKYDARENFTLKSRPPKNPLKLHYRIAAKSYRLGRNSAFAVAKKVVRK